METRANEHICSRCSHPSGKFEEFPKEEIQTSIPERFEKIVRIHAKRLAVRSLQHSLTYESLNQLSNRLARAIIARNGAGNEPVALLLEQGAFTIAAILAVLKAGKIYVAIDPTLPSLRMRYILDDTGARLIVTNEKNVSRAGELARNGCQLLDVDRIDADLSTQNIGLSLPPETLAYIMYTSGSTGQPKGVIHSHRNVLHSCKNYTNGLRISVEDRLSLLHSCSFNASVYNLFGGLLNGAALFPLDLKQEGVHRLGNWLEKEEITICHTTPTAFFHAAGVFSRHQTFPHLRLMHLSSAPVSKADVERCKKHFSRNCIFVHRMGVTETSTIRWYFMDHDTPLNETRVPIGYPSDHKEVLLLDESGKEVGVGDIGEIAVRSCYLSPGYWGKPQLTQARFLQDPAGGNKRIYLTGDLGRIAPDGCVFHLGRKDLQVKIRGYRVELGEVELRLLEHPAVKEAVVVGRETQTGDRRLVAYFVPQGKPAPAVSELRRFLMAQFPDYMIPSAFIKRPSLPLTPNGRVDYSALPDLGGKRPALSTPFTAPKSSVEKKLAKIWAEVLAVEKVGAMDNFFDLGGNSLGASQVVSRVIQEFHLDLPVKALFDCPTVAQMAAVITTNQANRASDTELAQLLGEVDAMTEEEAQRRVNDIRSTTVDK